MGIWPTQRQYIADAAMIAFGVPVQVVAGGVGTDLTGVFMRSRDTEQNVGLAPTELPDPEVRLRASEWAATGGRRGDRVTVSGADYTVVDWYDDDCDFSRVVLRRYANP